LKQSLNKEWVFYYIDYEKLKSALREHHAWDHAAEQAYIGQLDKELDKVYTFQRVKAEEIIRRIAASEKEVNDAVASARQQPQGELSKEAEEGFDLLEEDLSDIIADVHDLARFTQLNYTGFQKIIKKHDVCLCARGAADGC
jgi:SPX domain protein involved in polyphosphate accumulation